MAKIIFLVPPNQFKNELDAGVYPSVGKSILDVGNTVTINITGCVRENLGIF